MKFEHCKIIRWQEQQLPKWVHVRQDARKPELELHALRQLSVGAALRVPAHDAGLLGKPVPNGARVHLNYALPCS